MFLFMGAVIITSNWFLIIDSVANSKDLNDISPASLQFFPGLIFKDLSGISNTYRFLFLMFLRLLII